MEEYNISDSVAKRARELTIKILRDSGYTDEEITRITKSQSDSDDQVAKRLILEYDGSMMYAERVDLKGEEYPVYRKKSA